MGNVNIQDGEFIPLDPNLPLNMEMEEEISECCSAELRNERCMDCKEFSSPYKD